MLARVCLCPADAPEAEASGSAAMAASPPPSCAAAELRRELREVGVAASAARGSLCGALVPRLPPLGTKAGEIRRERPRASSDATTGQLRKYDTS